MVGFESVHKIRFDDVDGAGIVYYPHFFHLCHATFEDFFDASGTLSYPELISTRRQGFPTVAIETGFLKPLAYGDSARVRLQTEKVGTSSAVFRYAIYRIRDDALCFEAKITTVLINLDTHRPLPIPDELRSIFASIQSPAHDEA